MPTRLIREGIISSERVEQLDALSEVFYRRLLNKVDDHGLYDARPSILRANLFPLRVDRVREADITRWMAACQTAGLIVLYENGGKPYLMVLNTEWDKRSKPKYPLPPENSCEQSQSDPNTSTVLRSRISLPVVDKEPRAARSPDGVKILTDLGVEEQHAKDWIAVRKAKRAPLTDTVIQNLHAQASKAGISVAQAVEICAKKSWQGFNADWDWGDTGKSSKPGKVDVTAGNLAWTREKLQ